MSYVAMVGYPFCALPPTEGFLWDDFCQILQSGQRIARLQSTKWHRNDGVESQPAKGAPTLQMTDDRQTDE